MGIINRIGSFLFGSDEAPEYGLTAQDIDRYIQQFRESGLEGISQVGQQAQQNTAARLAAMGSAPTPALTQAAFMPILERLASARTGLEGNLAGTQLSGLQHIADMNLQGQMAEWQEQQLFNRGATDFVSTALTNKYFPGA